MLVLITGFNVGLAQTSLDGSDTLSGSKATPELPFYLPYSSSAIPGLKKELEKNLQSAGLDFVKVQTADYWHPYQQGLRRGRVGFYLAAPHFASWAIHKHRFVPMLRLSEPLKYVIAARRDDARIFEVNDLANRVVCSQKAVNLDFILTTTALDNTLWSAQSKSVNSVPDAMKYDNQNCHAFAVSEHIFREYNLESPEKFIRLQQGDEYTNYAFLAHPDISETLQKQLMALLQTTEMTRLLSPIVNQYSSKPKLIPATLDDYPQHFIKPLTIYWGQ